MTRVRVVASSDLRKLIAVLFDWAETIQGCAPVIEATDDADRCWGALEKAADRVSFVVTSRFVRDARAWRALHDRTALRLTNRPPEALGPGFWYLERGTEARVVVGGAGLFRATGGASFESAAVIECSRRLEPAVAARAFLRQCLEAAVVPSPQLLSDEPEAGPTRTNYDPAGTLLLLDPRVRSLQLFEAEDEVRAAHERFLEKLTRRVDIGCDGLNREGEARWYMARDWVLRSVEKDGVLRYDVGPSTPGDDGRLRLPLHLAVRLDCERGGGNAAFARDDVNGKTFLVLTGEIRLGRVRLPREGVQRWTRFRRFALDGATHAETGHVEVLLEAGVPDSERQLSGVLAEVTRLAALVKDEPVESAKHDGSVADEDDEEERGDTRASFLDEDFETRVRRVWTALLGMGSLAKQDAVRMAAFALREAGVVEFKRLDPRGMISTAVKESIDQGVRYTTLFDRPARGQVRATCPEPGELPFPLWIESLSYVLDLAGGSLNRTEAKREAARYLVDFVGLRHRRLRAGGLVDRHLDHAIVRGVRYKVFIRKREILRLS